MIPEVAGDKVIFGDLVLPIIPAFPMHLPSSLPVLLMLLLAIDFPSHAAHHEDKPDTAQACRFTVGVQETLDPIFFVETMGPTMARLRKALPGCAIKSKLLPTSDFDKVTQSREIDILMSDSGLFAYGEKRWGARELAVRQSPRTTDPSKAVSAAIIVRQDRSDIETLSDLKGRKVAAVDDSSFDGWLITQALISREGHDPDTFWGEKTFTHYREPGVAELVLYGEADAGILPACKLESLMMQHAYRKNAFRVINLQPAEFLSCARSAPLYPDVVIASLPHVSSSLLKLLTLELMSQPVSHDGYAWTIAADFKGVDELYKTLKLGPYSYLRTFNWQIFWERYMIWVLAGMFLIFLMLVHIVRVNRLVDLRTRQLRDSLEKQITLEHEARESRHRMAQIERAGIVSQMSSMLAHEVLQPITSLINFSTGLRIYLSRKFGDDPIVVHTSNVIVEESQRVSDIVERVRFYAKGRTSERNEISVREIVDAAVRTFSHSTTAENVTIDVDIPDSLHVWVNRLEMELVVYNLLKNGASAMKDCETKHIAIHAQTDGPNVRLCVRDFGPVIDDRTFEQLCSPVISMKSDGLGLGLTLCRGIVELHSGGLFYERAKTGLTAIVVIPAALAEGGPAKNTQGKKS